LKLNGTHADYVNILGGSVRTINEKAKSLLVASKENGLEVNADKTAWTRFEIRQQDEVTV
jgi:hypothetical protein